jgi:hypothetical protein
MVHGKHNTATRGNDLLFTKYNTRPVKHPQGQYIGIEWDLANDRIDPDTVFDRKKVEDNASAGAWLLKHLADGKWHDTEQIFEMAGRHAHTVNAIKQAKLRNQRIEHKAEGFGPERRTLWRMK